MRKFSLLGAIVVLVLGASLTMAASPTASPHPAASPTPSLTPSSGSGTTTSQPLAATAPSTWSATVTPQVGLTGSVQFHENADKTGRVTLRLIGMSQNAPWIVEIYGGTASDPNLGDRVAVKSGPDVQRTGIDTLTINLSKAEMRAFQNDLAKFGIVVSISDGAHQSVATLPAS